MPIQRFQKIVLWAILLGILVYMLVLAFQDAEQTGQNPELIGPLVAWVCIVAMSWLIVWFRKLLFNLIDCIIDSLNNRFGD